MSRCTTSSSNLRPMRRLMAKSVLCGLVTAWRLAGWPTRTSPSLLKATIEGVVRSPSLFSITRGLPPSMMATQEFVVPRSMPITFAMVYSAEVSLKGGMYCPPLWVRDLSDSSHSGGDSRTIFELPVARPPALLGHDHPRRAQHPAVELVAPLDHLDHRVRGGVRGLLNHHGLVPVRV